ncbi:MAG: hypothetical protein IPI97_03440 [Nitrosomonas sp.]|nr:hypothetical protein [Nitrosomonas sp.]MBK7364091.1 hypothetical protein [Nitrosomonas sp.]
MMINQRVIYSALLLVISAGLSSLANAVVENRAPLFVQTDGRLALQLSTGWNTFYSPFMYPQALFYPYPLFVNPCYPYAHCGAFNQYQLLQERRKRSAKSLGQSVKQRTFAFDQLALEHQRRGKMYRTNENEIVPARKGDSKIKPEFSNSGAFLPTFLEQHNHSVKR